MQRPTISSIVRSKRNGRSSAPVHAWIRRSAAEHWRTLHVLDGNTIQSPSWTLCNQQLQWDRIVRLSQTARRTIRLAPRFERCPGPAQICMCDAALAAASTVLHLRVWRYGVGVADFGNRLLLAVQHEDLYGFDDGT